MTETYATPEEMLSDLLELGLRDRVHVLSKDDEDALLQLYRKKVPQYFPLVGGSIVVSYKDRIEGASGYPAREKAFLSKSRSRMLTSAGRYCLSALGRRALSYAIYACADS